ncbi:MAG: D-glycero-beta-D-manno-heptose 1-phosphate adenylyltransferase [Armatimonadetes bacterium]|nr:D-glycero-beta-D-manno-heptose 1-phosphate adenylyltransferase [Armatimonadota bacterium]
MLDYRDKLVSRDHLAAIVAYLRRDGRKIVFTNGCFDLLHIGHVRYLAAASKHGDVLIVAVNSDASVKRLKGPNRPLVPADERAEMLAALAFVDYVVIFEEDTPDNLLRLVRPDVHVKGGDYRPDELPEAPLVRSLGAEIVIAPLVDGRSTTIYITRIIERYLPEFRQSQEGAE